MKSYLLQTREYTGKKLCAYSGYKSTYTAWQTIRKEPCTDDGARAAETWLRTTPRGMEQRRLKCGKWTLTREEAVTSNQPINDQ